MKLLMGKQLSFEIDPNPNGLPVLIITTRFMSSRYISDMFLGKKETEELIQKLQELVKELE